MYYADLLTIPVHVFHLLSSQTEAEYIDFISLYNDRGLLQLQAGTLSWAIMANMDL